MSPKVAITSEDVKIYDSIFGRFNPLVERANANLTASASPRVNGSATVQATADNHPVNNAAQPTLIDLSSQTDFASRIAVSARQRQAEISFLRDQAITTGNAELLTQADAMENRLKAFAEANGMIQSRASSQAQVDAQAQAQAKAQAMSESRNRLQATLRSKIESGIAPGASIDAQAQAAAQSRGQLQAQENAAAAAQAHANANSALNAAWQPPRSADRRNGSAKGNAESTGSANGPRR